MRMESFCRSIMEHPKATVGAIVLNRTGEILVLNSKKWNGNYTLVAGHIEFGETAKQAVKREVKEETGLDVENINFLALEERIQQNDIGEFHKSGHWICLNYTCETVNGDVILNAESESYGWFESTKLLGLNNVDSITRKTVQKFTEVYGNKENTIVEPGEYQHYKGNFYEVLGTARHSESLGLMVVYRSLYTHPQFGENALWVRPVKMFVEMVELDGETVPRFRKVER